MQNKIILVLAVVLVSLLTVASVDPSESECKQKRRAAEKQIESIERSGRGSNIAILVPKCNEDGSYAQLQCHHNSTFCQCWDREGRPASSPKKNLERCTCLLERAEGLKRLPASSTDEVSTSCQPDGSFQPRQCNRSACWCVNPTTGKKLGAESKDKGLKC